MTIMTLSEAASQVASKLAIDGIVAIGQKESIVHVDIDGLVLLLTDYRRMRSLLAEKGIE